MNLDNEAKSLELSSAAALAHTHKEFETAHRLYIQALKYNPQEVQTIREFVTLLYDLGQFDAALEQANIAVALEPFNAANYHTLGSALLHFERFTEAEEAYNRAIAIAPCIPRTRHALAEMRLCAQKWEAGWQDYHWRHVGPVSTVRCPEPAIDALPKDCTDLFVWHDAGHGDTIWAARYFGWLRDMGVKVTLECQPALVSLMAPLVHRIHVRDYAWGIPFPYQYHVPLMSLPRVYGLTTGKWEIPSVSYIEAPAPSSVPSEKVVGYCWHGNQEWAFDAWRSMDAESGTKLKCSLGKYVVPVMPDENPTLRTFADTANTLAALDCFVSTDTANWHLAGAMGVKTLVLMSGKTDWRAPIGRTDSPWYENVTIYRRQINEPWDAAIEFASEWAS